MPVNSVVRAHIDESLKQEASVILESAGLTLSDASRMTLVRIVADKAPASIRSRRTPKPSRR